MAPVVERLRDQDAKGQVTAINVLATLDPALVASHYEMIQQVLSGGNTLLHLAAELAEYDSLFAVQLLGIKHRKRYLLAQNLAGDTPLHIAAKVGCLTTCRTLVRLGSLINM